jgi:hypothetical protein
MKSATTSYGWWTGLAVLVAFALVLYFWTGTDEPQTKDPPLAVASPRGVTFTATRVDRPTIMPPATGRSSASMPTEGSSQAPPTPGIFDFAQLPRPAMTKAATETERFTTNDRFTQDDLQHPERYFAVAEHMPELRRPEERRDTLDFFLAYRDKLRRDLEAAQSPDQRAEILTVLERYEDAIQRLRDLIDADPAAN